MATRSGAQGRAFDAPLFIRSDGRPWRKGAEHGLSGFHPRAIVASIGPDPDDVTFYALRHSSIVRHLLHNVTI
jgi:hypothetical protein